MTGRSWLVLLGLLLVICIGLYFLMHTEKPLEPVGLAAALKAADRPGTELGQLIFLADYLTQDQRGVLISEIQLPDRPGKYALLESQGQILEYAAAVGDQEVFAKAWLGLQYFYSPDKTLAWRIEQTSGTAATAGALVDELRVIRSLMAGAEVFQNEAYRRQGLELLRQLAKFNPPNGPCADFAGKAEAAKKLSLFYIDPQALTYGEEACFASTLAILEKAPQRGVFYPAYYDLKDKEYIYPEKVNLVEQLYTARFLLQTGRKPEKFVEFICQGLQGGTGLYNYYLPDGTPQGTDTSVAVYALAAALLTEAGEPVCARLCWNQLEQWQQDAPSRGVYYSALPGRAYCFDQLEVLLLRTMQEGKKNG